MEDAGTILIAVGDGVLADSLRFSLELEGYQAKLCDELSMYSALAGKAPAGCVVIDQDVFTRMVNGKGKALFAKLDIPVVLIVGRETNSIIARAKAAGVTRVIEQPLLGPVLIDAVRNVLAP